MPFLLIFTEFRIWVCQCTESPGTNGVRRPPQAKQQTCSWCTLSQQWYLLVFRTPTPDRWCIKGTQITNLIKSMGQFITKILKFWVFTLIYPAWGEKKILKMSITIMNIWGEKSVLPLMGVEPSPFLFWWSLLVHLVRMHWLLFLTALLLVAASLSSFKNVVHVEPTLINHSQGIKIMTAFNVRRNGSKWNCLIRTIKRVSKIVKRGCSKFKVDVPLCTICFFVFCVWFS